MLQQKENLMRTNMTTPKRIRETKQQLLAQIEAYRQAVVEQSNIIQQIQTFQIDVEKEAREQIAQQTHLQKVYASLDVSGKRIGMAMSILYPLNEMNLGSTMDLTDDDVKQVANKVLQNELEKIAEQQLLERKQKLKVK